MASIEKTKYSHYGNVVKLSNGAADVLVTTDMGPRVIYYGFPGGTNILAELSLDEAVETSLGKWRPMGGHRLWTAPEAIPRGYTPDNDPVDVEILEPCAVRVRPAPDTVASVQKEITIALDSKGTGVTLTHTITNIGLWPIELAPWGLTIMNGGGTTIFPQEPFAPHTECLLPARPLVLWSYTDMADPRWKFGKKFVRLSCDAKLDYPQKIGAAVKAGWAAYHRGDLLFVKRFTHEDCARYPDFGCNFETFTKGSFMEVETLGALTKLEPGECAVHCEKWHLFSGVSLGDSDDSIEAAIMPLVDKCG
jgi:hypothetical protein